MSDTLKNLNKEQKEAVIHEKGPLLIVAGAGTGKTTVITRKIAWLIEKGLAKPEEILALTFTEKAAGEMEERIDRLLPYGYVDLWVMTFHSFAEKILRAKGLDIGLPANFKVVEPTGQWLLVRQNLDKFDLDYYRPRGNPTKFIHALLTHFSRAKDEVISPQEYLEYAEGLKLDKDKSGDQGDEKTRLTEIANAYHIYNQLLLDKESLDFGDLINYCLELFEKRPEILKQYTKQFKYILIDEFQDTNWAQNELIKLLAAPKNNLTVVGDDDQSIYKFRGASISNILQFKKDFPDSKEIVLVDNYRSAQEVLDKAYEFIQLNNPNRLEVQLKAGGKTISKKLKSKVGKEAVIEHLCGETLNDEIRLVCDKIEELKNKDSESTWDDFAILVRANESANPFVNELSRRGISNQFMALRGLYSKSIILDIIAYFKLLDNYHESTAVFRILNLPFLNISPEDISTLTYESYRAGESLFEILKRAATIKKLSPETVETVGKLLINIEKHSQEARFKTVSEILRSFLQSEDEKFSYLKYLNRSDVSPIEKQKNVQDISYVNQFYRKIQKFENEYPDPKLSVFMDKFNLELESGETGGLAFDIEAGPEMVRIMTIHGAKGLEFKYVFIVNLVDRKFPTDERKDPIELPEPLIKEIIPEGNIHLEEERRLFYVAMTRAKKGLFFTSAYDYGGARLKKPSRFLFELGFDVKTKTGKKEEEKLSAKEVQAIVQKRPYRLPRSFSFTQLTAFNRCPFQYKLAHILKVPVFGNAVFSFGKTMHNTLDAFMSGLAEQDKSAQSDLFNQKTTKVKIPPLEKLMEIYEENWIDSWYANKKQKEEYYEQGKKSLKGFYDEIKNNPPKVKYLERGFSWKIKDYYMRGRMDRVDVLEEGIEIVDYKTGKPKENGKLTTEDKEQLLIYQMAAEEVYKEKPAKLTFHYLNDNSKVSFLGTSDDLVDLKEKILDRIDKINKSDFKATPGFHCKFCDFKGICEFKAY